MIHQPTRFLRVWEVREPIEGGDKARLIVALPTCHDGEDLSHHHMGEQLAGALWRVACSHQAVEGLPRLGRRAVTQLGVHNVQYGFGELRISLGRHGVQRWSRGLSPALVLARHRVLLQRGASFRLECSNTVSFPSVSVVHRYNTGRYRASLFARDRVAAVGSML